MYDPILEPIDSRKLIDKTESLSQAYNNNKTFKTYAFIKWIQYFPGGKEKSIVDLDKA